MVFGFGRQRPVKEQVFNCVRRNDFGALQRLLHNMADHASPSVYTVMEDLEWSGNREGQTALCLAAQMGQQEAVALLIRKGANINACSSRRDGGTPLHEAAASVKMAIAQMLMRAGASPFVENHHGDTAYDLAILRKATALVREMERLSHLGAYMQIKVPTFFGFARDFKEFWGVVVPRLPPPGASAAGRAVQHTQLYLYLTYDAAVPTSKLWTDGAQLFASQQGGQKRLFVMMLHQTHAPPANVAYNHDPRSGRLCLVFKASPRPGHGNALHTLLNIVNNNLAAPGAAPAAPAAPAAAPVAPQAPPAPPAPHAAAAPAAPSAPPVPSAPAYPAIPMPDRPQPVAAPPAPVIPPPPDHVMPPAADSDAAAPVPSFTKAPAGLAADAAASAPAADKGSDDDPENEQMLCCICMERPKSCGFLHGRGECLHVCACKECAERWFREHGTCPVCNARADTIVPVYW